ncbi:MAG: hypothetical protein ACRDEA_22970 [Microcystaceae cyanobacterium]
MNESIIFLTAIFKPGVYPNGLSCVLAPNSVMTDYTGTQHCGSRYLFD